MADDENDWIEGVRDGDAEALDKVFRLYFADLVDFACRRMRNKNNPDAEDAAASAMRTFVRRAGDGQFDQLANQLELFRLLSVIVLRKAINHKRKVKKMVNASAFDSDDSSGGGDFLAKNVADCQGSDQFAIVQETISQLLDALRSKLLQDTVLLQLEGYTNPEIADLLGISVRSVQRHVNTIREILSSLEQFESQNASL